jgi:hypothetical protein
MELIRKTGRRADVQKIPSILGKRKFPRERR